MLQLVYISSSTSKGVDLSPGILPISRRNNARDGVTGLLYADSRRFLQALEGPEDKVMAAFARIQADDRHRAVVILSRREIDVREFGSWDMAARDSGMTEDEFAGKLSLLIAHAAPAVRGTFDGLAKLRRAA